MSVESAIVTLLAVALGSFAKGATGFGLPVVAIPFMAAFMNVTDAVVIMVIPSVVSNWRLLWEHRRERTGVPGLWPLITLGLIGVAFGTWALAAVPRKLLTLTLAAWIVVYLLTRWVNPHLRISAQSARLLAPMVGLMAGLLQGTTGVSSPLVVPYTQALGVRRPAYIFTLAALFTVFSSAQFLIVASYGLFTLHRLIAGGVAAVATLLILPLGIRLGRHLDARGFNAIIVALLIVIVMKLLVEGFRA